MSERVCTKVLASPVRLKVLTWLKDPVDNFPPQSDGDLVTDGVCSDFIATKAELGASTTSRHLNLLADAGLVIATRKRGWTFYRHDDAAIERIGRSLKEAL